MKKRYIYLSITLIIWFILNLLLELSGFYAPNSFFISLIIYFVTIVIFGIGYIGYELDEKPYVLLSSLASSPLILFIILTYIRTESYIIAFFLVPLIFGIVMLISMGITAGVGGLEIELSELPKYLIVIPIYYLINFIIITILGFLNITINAPFPLLATNINPFSWITVSILIYALSYIFLLPLA